MKRVICAALIVCMLLSISVPCFAAEEQSVSPRYAYIDDNFCSLTINASGTATCKASCTASSAAYKVRINCYYQYYYGSKWSSFKYWTSTGYYYASVNEQANTISGVSQYRIMSVCSIYDSSDNLLETVTYYDYATYTPST